MNILVTGCNGQLGKELQKISNIYYDYNWIFTDVDALDICNENSVNEFFTSTSIDICINCAAYTAVDEAETEIGKARNINALGALNLAKACKRSNSLLIHISTDYVFDGTIERPYIESDPVSPNTVYGKTKAEGESNIISSGCSFVIIRTSWLYSSYGKNFVKSMLRLGRQQKSINVVDDQNGNPTWAYDLANVIMIFILRNGNNKIQEIFHYSNDGIIPWCNFAEAIFDINKIDCIVNPISSESYGSVANRPAFSALDKTKIKEYLGIKIPFWRDSLIKCIEEINNNN